MYGPGSFWYEPWANTVSDGMTGLKMAGLSNFQNFHNGHQIVPGDPNGNNSPHGFVNGTTYNTQQINFASVVDSTDIRWQATDRGLNPLAGLNPDTGLAWTAHEQDRARWGPIYSSRKSHRVITGYSRGIGDWLSGQVRAPHSNWFTYTFRLDIGNWNTANSRYRVWLAEDGKPYQKIKDHQNVNIGNPPTSAPNGGDYSTIWLTHFVTKRIAGGRSVSSRTNNIAGVTIHAVGGSTPIGTGTLSWNAAAQRLAFQATGESMGPAVGFSAANGKLLRNVFTASGNGYLIVGFDPARLPRLNQTDTINIADGRAHTFGSYAEALVGTLPINAPGGFPPIG